VDHRRHAARPHRRGGNHGTGHDDPTPERFGELERWARDHFSVEAFEYRWSAQDYMPADQRPYIGRSPGADNVFVGTGFKKWGLTNGTVAAEILTALINDRDHPWLAAFDATRIGDADAIKKLIHENTHVGKEFVKGRIARMRAHSVDHLAPGEGGVVQAEGEAIGAYHRPDGSYQTVSPTCTHMGCTVKWKAADTSWDCPCHGSRLDTDGAVLDGPAVRPLDVVDVEIS
jgi:nitrite reductase/ring-hydroxylating ferredoxin subunit